MARSDTEPTKPTRSPVLAILIGTLLALVVVFVMLYSPLCSWYAAWRNNMRIQETYNETLDEQNELQGEVDRLRTREGIEDEARRQGLVGEGETRVVIENLPKDDTTADTAPKEAPEDPWYLKALDAIFGFEG